MVSKRLAQLLELLKNRPEDTFLHYACMLEYMQSGQVEGAERQLNYLLEHHPDYLGTYYQAGRFFQQRGQPERAAVLFSAGLKLARERGDAKTAAELQSAMEELADGADAD